MDKRELRRKLFEVTFAEIEKGKEFPNAVKKIVMAVDVLNAVGIAEALLPKKQLKNLFPQEVACVEFAIDFE